MVAIEELFAAYFRLIGAPMEACGPGLYRVELDPSQVSELEGRTLLPWNLGDGNARTTYYFTFLPEMAGATEGVEFVGLGSQRLLQVIDAIRRHGQTTHFWAPAGGNVRPGLNIVDVRYRPFYFFIVRVERRPNNQASSLVRIGVDRVEGLAMRRIAEVLPSYRLLEGTPDDTPLPIERAAIDFDRAFELAFEELVASLEEEDLAWAVQQSLTVDRELKRLKSFFAEKARDGDRHEVDEARRLSELEHLKPALVARVQGVAAAHLPVAIADGFVEYLPFLP